MDDVAVVEGRVLPPKQACVVLVNEEREVRTQFAVFVAEALGERGMSTHQGVEGLADSPSVERHIAGAPRETAKRAVQQHPHAGTTIGRRHFRHLSPHVSPG